MEIRDIFHKVRNHKSALRHVVNYLREDRYEIFETYSPEQLYPFLYRPEWLHKYVGRVIPIFDRLEYMYGYAKIAFDNDNRQLAEEILREMEEKSPDNTYVQNLKVLLGFKINNLQSNPAVSQSIINGDRLDLVDYISGVPIPVKFRSNEMIQRLVNKPHLEMVIFSCGTDPQVEFYKSINPNYDVQEAICGSISRGLGRFKSVMEENSIELGVNHLYTAVGIGNREVAEYIENELNLTFGDKGLDYKAKNGLMENGDANEFIRRILTGEYSNYWFKVIPVESAKKIFENPSMENYYQYLHPKTLVQVLK